MAKQFDNLYETLLSFEYLHKAFKKAAKGKRGNEAVASFEWNLESNLLCLLEELQTGSY